NGDPEPDIGLSIVFWPQWKPREDRDDPLVLDSIKHIESVDFVFEPGAQGRVIQALSSKFVGGETVKEEKKEKLMTEKAGDEQGFVTNEEVAQENPVDDTQGVPLHRSTDATRKQVIAAHDAAKQALIIAQALQEEIKRIQEDDVIDLGDEAPRGAHVQVGKSGFERFELAAQAMLSAEKPPSDVRPLSGIREMYIMLSGDYEMTGVFRPERVQFAVVDSSTMAGLVANALNKRVVNLFQMYPRWWEPIVSIEDFTSLQQVKWITLGGVGELPTVNEGQAYTELTWDDQTETADFIKKGGYLGVTLETIDKDDTRRVQAAPRALAQAAWLTLAKSISSIFTQSSGVGPTMSDGNALFHANHSNLGSTALSTTEWYVVRNAMRKQTELNSGERLGALTAPRYLLVPPDLEITAMKVLASEKDYAYALSNATDGPINPEAEGEGRAERLRVARERVVVIDLWTDTDNWAAAADPNLYPTIGLGFRYGRVPEMFSVASPLAGLMFSNDTMPVKVRWFFATGPMDWRGLYKENV
ncbi:MAG: hypothetical protein PVG14_09510, partial [Anaerolineales bacterium]